MRPSATRCARSLLLVLLAVAVGAPTAAQTPGTCEPGTAENDLDASDVFARLFNTGSLFFGNTTTNGRGYLVPFSSLRSPIFAAGIWVGGRIDGDLRVAAARYTRFEFRPGPLDPGAVLPNATCRHTNARGREAWDRIYVLSTFDLERYEQGAEPVLDLFDWPVGLGAPAVDAGGRPLVPTSRDQLLDLEAGERPVLYGSQTAFWVMNDVGAVHAETGSDPIGLEVQVLAWSIADDDPAFDQGTFYRYRLVNRNSRPFEDARFSVFADTDLGDATDDWVGTDTTRGMMFTYNGDDFDDPSANGYGIPPAVGFDLLDGRLGAATMWCGGCPQPATQDPRTAEEYFNHMQGRWKDGVPFTEAGYGYMTDGPETVFAFAGDPVVNACWSMANDCLGGSVNPNDQRQVVHSPAFTIPPGAWVDRHVAIVFAQGADHLDSVTRLRAASDRVQAAFDDGHLFDPRPFSGPTLAAPLLLDPPDGAVFVDSVATMRWRPVPGAQFYEFQVDDAPDFETPLYQYNWTDTEFGDGGAYNEVAQRYWRVRARGHGAVSPYSEVRRFTVYLYRSEWMGEGGGFLEMAYGGDPDTCPDPSNPEDYGCENDLARNTVWHDGNVNDDYYLTSGFSSLPDFCYPGGELACLNRYYEAAVGDAFEIRFTAAGGLGVYAFTDSTVVRVPFEVWNVGDPDDPADDLRMIPFINPNEDGEALTNWADRFTGTDYWRESPCEGGCPTTDWIYGMMPDRPDGYARFEAAAFAFGGPGAVYDPDGDGDAQLDLDPVTGEPCARQGFYADFCYRNQYFPGNYGTSSFIYPLGRVVFADLAGDGTTPPAGTTVRFLHNERLPVRDVPPPGPIAQVPGAYDLGRIYPNPFNPRAVVPFSLPRSASVRVVVYDVLGREVAVLVQERLPAGEHRTVFDGAGLASGLYLVSFEADGVRRELRAVTLLR